VENNNMIEFPLNPYTLPEGIEYIRNVKCVEPFGDADSNKDTMIDMGMKIFLEKGIRFSVLDAWEKSGPEGAFYKEGLKEIQKYIYPGVEYKYWTVKDKDGGYGRLLGYAFVPGLDISLNEHLLLCGHGTIYGLKYKGTRKTITKSDRKRIVKERLEKFPDTTRFEMQQIIHNLAGVKV
jgi:hypothetical protein